MNTKSNKARGPVRLTKETGSPVISKTANPQRASVNQSQGPRTGNSGNTAKQSTFLSEKSDRSGYLKSLADMVSNAFSARGSAMKPNLPVERDKEALRSISPDTKVKRGPTKGNK